MATGQSALEREVAANVLISPDVTSVSQIHQWARSKRAEIGRAFSMKGGWEAWLQVELAFYLEDKYGPGSVVREQHVYSDGSLAVDLFVTTPDGTRSLFELKCESVNQDCRFNKGEMVLENGQPVSKHTHRGPHSTGPLIPAFAKRMELELERMEMIAAACRPCQCTVLGISLTREALDFAEAEKDRDDNYFQAVSARTIHRSIPGSNIDPNDTFALWFKTAIVREPFNLGGSIWV